METIDDKNPDVRLYDSFSEFVENMKKAISNDINNAKSLLRKDWFVPDKNKESSCLDVDKIPDKFEREELQKAYTRYVTQARMPVEALSIKYQNGIIAACEQAYRVRHVSVPRAVAQGYMDGLRWSNGVIPLILVNRIKVLSDLADKDYKGRNA